MNDIPRKQHGQPVKSPIFFTVPNTDYSTSMSGYISRNRWVKKSLPANCVYCPGSQLHDWRSSRRRRKQSCCCAALPPPLLSCHIAGDSVGAGVHRFLLGHQLHVYSDLRAVGSSVGAGRQEGVTILFFPGRYKRTVPKTAELVLVWLKLNKLLGKAKLASKLPGAVRPAPASWVHTHTCDTAVNAISTLLTLAKKWQSCVSTADPLPIYTRRN